ncbi:MULTISPECIES: helix-turn-helix domain-containing protein [Halocynthiibacter]|uniref:Helix-turn-helix domain-containing protein n=1 Tax=Halocynthiibacter halioticoli TaxID=2986804 RepID=A0AAE3IZT5_9RHOB|nr:MULTISPECIES: helix-turn-helix transcriptional regulator [Halocynthiibacter]MCV6823941.1 helix-turn-helix domain-containing protein [Halocynthiibacter halioticoli]MCW4056942.1 helix-turn-helix domain-containing protein [Halocynthiibacter sp. SDUM655004]
MAARELTGHRIRDRRVALGRKQGELAAQVGISPSYLNLIEHNRRRIGGKLLVDIARALGVEPSILSEGTEATLLAQLLTAATERMELDPEVVEIEAFAARYPGWAALLADQTSRIATLERQVEALTDRLAHDPVLSGAMHEVLSTVTAIRSTAAILADPQEMEQAWRDRFQRNLYEDSVRLAESSQALVTYLDRDQGPVSGMNTPLEALEAFLRERQYHVAALEAGQEGVAAREEIEAILDMSSLPNDAARETVRAYLKRYAEDAAQMPLAQFAEAVVEHAYNPARLAEKFSCDLAAVMRRMVSLPAEDDSTRIGIAVCDGTGALTLRRPIDGFPLPRFSGAHEDWPLYQALARPMMPLRQVVQQGQGSASRRFLTYAICLPASPLSFDAPPVHEASMLILPPALVPEIANEPSPLVLSGAKTLT